MRLTGASSRSLKSPPCKFIRYTCEGKFYQEVDMSGECCDKCGEHCVDCRCKQEQRKYKACKDTAVTSVLQPGTKIYTRGACAIMVSPPCEDAGWHMSISSPNRHPTWEEIRDAWYDLIPDADKRNGAMFFPPKDQYVNAHTHCFHVHEVPVDLKNMFKNDKV